jgi:RNA polymerase sigma-70 factor (ECF subfamily)
VGVNLEAKRRLGAVNTNEESFETLFAAQYARVARIANRVLADPHEAEDVAQEVFIDFNRLHSASAPYAAAWLYRAAAHKALNRVRGRRRRERRELSQAADEGASTMDPQHLLEVSEDRRMVRQALARLAPKPATVLVLRASGLSYAEVAQSLGVGIGQIGTLLRRAEAALRKEVTRGTSN